ncbi:MAG TPA: CPBP family intramembrane glutamic endopeptidase [Methanocella sp.]|uniref:CPBP family intramembrane glutamic endopeptidase n=1 Tax=Methanocella sp. TaxID=2052833 RepID=UPI002C47B151|nr:CPBP family intramembrane glutamic endopeptidase [Methanocella sp.]HTY90252.1 CPBP family intramembrane glutamic endopeptidase [Methanocella sp.]
MSDVKKGARKQKGGSTAGAKVSRELGISVMVAVLYGLFLVETIWESSLLGLAFSIILFGILVLMAYLLGGSKKEQRQFRSLVLVFIGLSLLSIIVELLRYLDIPAAAGTFWAGALGAAIAIASVIAIAVLVYIEKDELKKLYIHAGDVKAMWLGAAGLIICLVAGLAGAYFVFGGSILGQDKFLRIAASVIIFGVLAGIVEEAWFRGLLLTRIVPILGESRGNIYQAAVFGAFETVLFYMITGQAAYIPVIFIIGIFMGYYWGRATIKADSLAAPALLHVGLYVLLLLPLVTGLSS